MNPRQKAVRKARHIMRLGSEDPVCVLCGESNPNRLMRLQGHHLTGWQRDPAFQVIVCFNCQHELHFRAPIVGATFGKREGRVPARAAARLRSVALFHDMEADYLRRWAQELDAEEGKKSFSKELKGRRKTATAEPSGNGRALYRKAAR